MKNIVVNFESKTIELTKNFSKRAGVYGPRNDEKCY